ncbi:hypothetical protein J6590_006557 [Homalodisca vitripennis]|nr:hypothetical protein J6590_006557 [Homalodisca vitripennis]
MKGLIAVHKYNAPQSASCGGLRVHVSRRSNENKTNGSGDSGVTYIRDRACRHHKTDLGYNDSYNINISLLHRVCSLVYSTARSLYKCFKAVRPCELRQSEAGVSPSPPLPSTPQYIVARRPAQLALFRGNVEVKREISVPATPRERDLFGYSVISSISQPQLCFPHLRHRPQSVINFRLKPPEPLNITANLPIGQEDHIGMIRSEVSGVWYLETQSRCVVVVMREFVTTRTVNVSLGRRSELNVLELIPEIKNRTYLLVEVYPNLGDAQTSLAQLCQELLRLAVFPSGDRTGSSLSGCRLHRIELASCDRVSRDPTDQSSGS